MPFYLENIQDKFRAMHFRHLRTLYLILMTFPKKRLKIIVSLHQSNSVMSNSSFVFATIVANQLVHSPHFCDIAKKASLLSNMPRLVDKFYILGHVYSHSFDVLKCKLNEKILHYINLAITVHTLIFVLFSPK